MDWFEDTLKEQYKIVKIIKQSDKSYITQLRHKKINRDIIKREFNGDGGVYKILQGISHPNLPKVFQVVQNGESCTVLEEYIDGLTVSEVIESGTYSENGVIKVILNICDALTALHSLGIIHRDIKPENIMITNDGRIILIDFDASRLYKPYQSEDTRIIGTTGYAAPEQFGIAQTDERTDIFSVGVLMNVMLTGEHPSKKLYKGKLKNVIEKCIMIDPNQRYQTALELKVNL